MNSPKGIARTWAVVPTVALAAMILLTMCVMASSVQAFEPSGPEVFGVYAFVNVLENEDGSSAVQAGSHPFMLTTSLTFNHEVTRVEEREEENGKEEEVHIGEPEVTANIYGNPKHVEVNLPAGLVVNPQVTSVKCTEAELEEKHEGGQGGAGGCPDASAVGVDIPSISPFGEEIRSAIYNMVPPPGVPAEFGVNPGGQGLIFHILGKVRTGGDYGLTGEVQNLTQKVSVYGAKLVFWGDPTAEVHDSERGICATRGTVTKKLEEEGAGDHENRYDCPLSPGGRTGKPFLTMPGSCTGSQLETTANVDSWQEPSDLITPPSARSPAVTGCEGLPFNPSLDVQPAPSGLGTEAPSGLSFDLKMPQEQSVGAPGEADLKKVVVTLPEGMAVSPSAANGLGACSPAQIGLHNADKPSCPDSSKLAEAEVTTPLLEAPLKGAVYLAQQETFEGALIGLYLVVEGQGALVKLGGKATLNQQTGQITATFDDNPQLPFNDVKLKFFEGQLAPLVTPSTCATYTTASQLTSWSSSIPIAPPAGSFTVNQGCGHGFVPAFTAGTTNLQAGAHTPFSLTLSRQDGEQRLGSVRVEMPPGLLANIKSVAQCPEPQASNGECGEASLIGESTASAGPGEDPYWVKGGKVYLTGPYAGAPFGLSIVVPAIAGPFNLGNVIARASISVDSHTAQAIVTSSLPTIKDGIPLDVRTVNVMINREGFVFNPTSCKPSSVTGVIGSTTDTLAGVSSPFQAANCAKLPFKPSFKASTQAKTSKASGASLTVRVGSGTGQANIAKVRVLLPKQLPARLTTLQKACTEAQFNIDPAGCPAASLVGTATAVTPVLAHPLTGPAYLVSHGGAAFPDVVFVLQGEGIVLYLDGNTNIKKGITSSTFNSVPDAPISTFETVFPEGPHSVLATDIPANAKSSMCGQSLTMPTAITGQNGAVVTQTTKISITGCPPIPPKKPKTKKVNKNKKK